jgi:hypothetical protein
VQLESLQTTLEKKQDSWIETNQSAPTAIASEPGISMDAGNYKRVRRVSYHTRARVHETPFL